MSPGRTTPPFRTIGHRPLTTHIFVAGGEYLDSDAVCAVRRSLIQESATVDNPERAARLGIGDPFRLAESGLVAQRAPGPGHT